MRTQAKNTKHQKIKSENVKQCSSDDGGSRIERENN